MQLAVCAKEGRARMLAEGNGSCHSSKSVVEEGAVRKHHLLPLSEAKRLEEGTPSRKRLEWQRQEDSFTGAWQTSTSLFLQSSLGNRVPLGGPRAHSRNHARSQRKTVKEPTRELWFSSLSPQKDCELLEKRDGVQSTGGSLSPASAARLRAQYVQIQGCYGTRKMGFPIRQN